MAQAPRWISAPRPLTSPKSPGDACGAPSRAPWPPRQTPPDAPISPSGSARCPVRSSSAGSRPGTPFGLPRLLHRGALWSTTPLLRKTPQYRRSNQKNNKLPLLPDHCGHQGVRRELLRNGTGLRLRSNDENEMAEASNKQKVPQMRDFPWRARQDSNLRPSDS